MQEKGLMDQIHELTFQQSTLSAQKQTSRQTIRSLNSKIEDLQNPLDSLSIDEADLTSIRSSMQNTSSSLQILEEEFTNKSWDQKISSLEQQVFSVDEELKSIQTELTSSSAQSEFRAKIDVLKADLNKKTQARRVLISSNAERFRELVGVELTATTADSQINVLLRRKADDLEEAERMLDGTAKEITQYEAKLFTIKEQLKNKQKERNEAYAKVMAVCEASIDDFPAVANEKEEDVTKLKL